MKTQPTLRSRLIVAQLVLVAVVALSGLLAVKLLTPVLFVNRVQGRGGAVLGEGQSAGGGGHGNRSLTVTAEIQNAYNDALTSALLIAGLVGLVASLALATLLSRRLLHRLGDVQHAAHQLATGDYEHSILVPPEPELADLARSINTLGSTLAATEESRARLMSDVAHELRNPLTTIEGYMEGLIDGVLPATVETYGVVAEEAHRLKRITEDLSFMSRAEEGAVSYQMTAMDLAELARRTVERMTPSFDDAGLSMHLSLDQPVTVIADPARLTQTLSNLLGNAIAHTPRGGSVSVVAQRDKTWGVLAVTDSGDGLEHDQLEIIFERFTRFRDGPGLGIGLNIARSIVVGHGGTLEATSEGAGCGSTFTLKLPLRTS